jgi:hypothetical protein
MSVVVAYEITLICGYNYEADSAVHIIYIYKLYCSVKCINSSCGLVSDHHIGFVS